MKFADIKSQLRNIEPEMIYSLAAVRKDCMQSPEEISLIDIACKVNSVTRIYDAYCNYLPNTSSPTYLPCGGIESYLESEINYFCILCPSRQQLIGDVSLHVAPVLSAVGFVDGGTISYDNKVIYHKWTFNDKEYRVYYVHADRTLEFCAHRRREAETALILYRMLIDEHSVVYKDYERLLLTIKVGLQVTDLTRISTEAFGMNVTEYFKLYIKLLKESQCASSKIKKLPGDGSVKVLNFLLDMISFSDTEDEKFTVKDNMKLLDNILAEDTLVCGESALAYWDLIDDKVQPVSICATPYGIDNVSCSVYKTVKHRLHKELHYCIQFSENSNLYIPVKERALIEYAMSSERKDNILYEAVIHYLEQVDSLDTLYGMAYLLDVRAMFVDTLICCAIVGGKVSEVRKLF